MERFFVRVPGHDSYFEVMSIEGSSAQLDTIYTLHAGLIEIRLEDDEDSDFFISMDGDMFLYMAVSPLFQEDDPATLPPGTVTDDDSANPLTWLFISLGVVGVVFAGLQIIKARKSVKAA